MTSALYVVSLQPYSGKTAMCLGLGKQFKAEGLSVGYMKPLGTLPVEVGGQQTDEDVLFVLRTLDLNEPLEMACPILLTPETLQEPLRGPVTNKAESVRAAYNHLSRNVDVMILEGGADISDGYALGLPQSFLAETTNSKVVIVARYMPDLAMDDILLAKDTFGERLIGVIVNAAPPEAVKVLKEKFPAFLSRNGLRLFGVLPVDKFLMAISVRELARLLNGQILSAGDKQDELVENFSIGAMNVDTALKYFLRTPNKAVITGGDRADIQLAALQTSTKAIVLTGNLYPDAVILGRAAEMGIPMILVKSDTMATVEVVERALGHIRLSTQQQIDRLSEMIRTEVDLRALRQSLEL